MLYIRHLNPKNVVEYYMDVSKYFSDDFIKNYDFITLNIEGKEYKEYGYKTGIYIIPIHKTKCMESNFTEHIYYENAKKLKPYKVIIDGVNRYYCNKCNTLARIIKKEYKRPKGDKCWSCYLGKK
jgi:hypothetical protein